MAYFKVITIDFVTSCTASHDQRGTTRDEDGNKTLCV